MLQEPPTVEINKDNFPVGTRALLGHSRDFQEYFCMEWSPAGRCKVQRHDGVTIWLDKDWLPLLLEVLPPKPA